MKKKGKNFKTEIIAVGVAIAAVLFLVFLIPKMKGSAPPAGTGGTPAGVQTEVSSALETVDWDSLFTSEETPAPVLEEYQKKKEEIPDLVGWLRIDQTGIDYPVVQRNNDFYVTHDVYGVEDAYGAIFLEQVNDIKKPDNNLMIYGHNRKDAKMFGELMEYKSEKYYKEHPYIQFDTLYARGRYEIISVFLSKVYTIDDTDFKYYQFFGSEDPKEFQNYVDQVKKLSLYKIGVSASPGDELLTLSTCEYSVDNGRLVVVAKKLPDE